MDAGSGGSEIVEAKDDLDLAHHSKGLNPIKVKPNEDERHGKNHMPVSQRSSLEDELNQLIEAIDLQVRGGHANKSNTSPVHKNPQKRPVRVGVMQSSGIPISETKTLKQALRGLCISQASELAAMKRLTKPKGLSELSDSAATRRFKREAGGHKGMTLSSHNGEGFIPERSSSHAYDKMAQLAKISESGLSHKLSASFALCEKLSTSPHSLAELGKGGSSLSAGASPSGSAAKATLTLLRARKPEESGTDPQLSASGHKITVLEPKGKLTSVSSASLSVNDSDLRHLSPKSHVVTPALRHKVPINRQPKQDLVSSSQNLKISSKNVATINANKSNPWIGAHKIDTRKHAVFPVTINFDQDSRTNSPSAKSASIVTLKSTIGIRSSLAKHDFDCKMAKNPGLVEKGECSHSSPSSRGEYSTSTSISEESFLCSSFNAPDRPHMSKDLRWQAIHHVEANHGLSLRHFKLIKRLGGGDIGIVYLAELLGTECLFALKVMDNEYLARRKKLPRARAEREILELLDHPFLPTLYCHFATEKLSCLVIDYCSGGDLHVLRQRQPGRHFPEEPARFYAAEVLLAIEYLHMLGIIYRDLKPENVLVRGDGHIMLTDFDLSLRCAVNPTLVNSSSNTVKGETGLCTDTPCIDPLCLDPSCVQVSCFSPRLATAGIKAKKRKSEPLTKWANTLPQLVAEPTDARSNSFVGTHEYLAPEIIRGDGHGSAVDWWTFGVFLYELLFGRTPFKGSENDQTLANVVIWNLKFPDSPETSYSAKDLIQRLLVKEPEKRLGSVHGAVEIKNHPFFGGLNWALIRSSTPPFYQSGTPFEVKQTRCVKFRSVREQLEFELF